MKTLRKPIHDRPHGWLAASLFLVLCRPLWAADVDLGLIGSWPLFPRGPAQAVAVSGSYAYVATSGGGLQIIDVSDPVHPRRVGSDGTSNRAYDVAFSGNVAYVTEGGWVDGTNWHRLQVIDISDPANPRRLGGCSLNVGDFSQVAVSGNYAYVANGWQLQVIDVSNSSSPQPVGAVTDVDQVTVVTVSANYAYVGGSWQESTNWLCGLLVADIANPANPRIVGRYRTSASVQSVAVSGDCAYMTESGWTEGWTNWHSGGLRVVRVSDPTHPQLAGSLDTSGDPCGVTTVGNFAYLTEARGYAPGLHPGGLRVIDISDPANPRLVGGNSTLSGSSVAAAGPCAYVAGGEYPYERVLGNSL